MTFLLDILNIILIKQYGKNCVMVPKKLSIIFSINNTNNTVFLEHKVTMISCDSEACSNKLHFQIQVIIYIYIYIYN